MTWTKRQIVEEAYAELALAGYAFDLTPEEMQAASRRLDAMMALWAQQGIELGYALNVSPESTDLDAESGLPLHAVQPVYTNLAKRLCSVHGKQCPASTLADAKAGMDALTLCAAYPREMAPKTGMPRGAGHRHQYDRPYFPQADTGPLAVDEGGNLEFLEP